MRSRKKHPVSKLRMLLIALILVVTSYILYTGQTYITKAQAQTCEQLKTRPQQFSMITMLSKHCQQTPQSPTKVCSPGKACVN